jgi:hypothetical protein
MRNHHPTGQKSQESANSLNAVPRTVQRHETHEPLGNRWQGRESSQPSSSNTNQDAPIIASTKAPALSAPDFPVNH